MVSPTAASFYLHISFEACCEAKRWNHLSCNLLRDLLKPKLALHQKFVKLPLGPSLQPSSEPFEPDLALHQAFMEPSPEPSPEQVDLDVALHQDRSTEEGCSLVNNMFSSCEISTRPGWLPACGCDHPPVGPRSKETCLQISQNHATCQVFYNCQ